MAELLEIEALNKRYGAVVVAKDIDLSLGERSCIGIIGPNGAGKSSLFNMLTGVTRPDSGVIRFDGADIGSLAPYRRARIGIVRAFQIPQSFSHLSVYENVLTAAYFGGGLGGSSAQDWVRDVLAKTGLIGKSDRLAGALRLLDRKRLELAKALASRARLLLLDEIAGGLTERETASVVELVAALKREHAIIWIEHIPHALRAVADRIVVLHFGKKLLDGHPGDVMDSPIVREIYMGLARDEPA